MEVQMEAQGVEHNGTSGGPVAADGGRFATYVTELREFFKSWGMGFGAPEDLASFASAVQGPGTFGEELASLSRSVVYRESGMIGIPELLKLMTVAMGGARVAEASEQVREPVRELLAFLGRAMRGGRGRSTPAASVAGEETTEAGRMHDWNPAAAAWGLEMKSHGQGSHGPGGQGGAVDVRNERSSPDPEFYWRARSIAGAEDLAEGSGLEAEFDVGRGDWPQADEIRPVPLMFPRKPDSEPAHKEVAKRPWARWPRVFAACAAAGVTVAAVLFLQPWAGDKAGAKDRSSVQAASDPGRSATDGAASGEVVVPILPGASPARAESLTNSADDVTAGGGASPGSTVAGPSSAAAAVLLAARVPSSKRPGPYPVSSGAMAANLISAPLPEYPKLAGGFHKDGRVVLQAVVSRNGKIVETHVLHGHRVLRGPATAAVRQWRYRPYVVNGHPTDVTTVVTVNFRRR